MSNQAPSVPNKLEHPCFPQPTDKTVRVWRYLDLSKLVWLLENRKLYLSRLDLLNDPHEGSTPGYAVAMRDLALRAAGIEEVSALMSARGRVARRSLYVGCWHLGNEESEAMWRLYCPNDAGVAIQTSYQRLLDSVAGDPYCYIGTVKYLDYEREFFPAGNIFYPVMHKRISFAHEREVRLVKTLSEYWSEEASLRSPAGTSIDWDPDVSVEAIYVSPYAQQFFCEVVRAIVRRFSPLLEGRVKWSQMRGEPVY